MPALPQKRLNEGRENLQNNGGSMIHGSKPDLLTPKPISQ